MLPANIQRRQHGLTFLYPGTERGFARGIAVAGLERRDSRLFEWWHIRHNPPMSPYICADRKSIGIDPAVCDMSFEHYKVRCGKQHSSAEQIVNAGGKKVTAPVKQQIIMEK